VPEIILVRVQRCRYCQKEMSCSPLEYEQNPFCTRCLTERTEKAAPVGGVRWTRRGNYVIAQAPQISPSGERERRPI
jgi:hypothetical protein